MFTFTGKYTVSGDTLELIPSDDKEKKFGTDKGPQKVKIKFDGNDKVTLIGFDEKSNKKDAVLTRIK